MTVASAAARPWVPPAWPSGGQGGLCFTRAADGDMGRERDRSSVFPGVAWLHQVHGSTVAVVGADGSAPTGPADAAVTSVGGVGLGVLTADCAPVVLWSPEGVVGVAHAGWRGLVAGVLGAAAATMRQVGARSVFAALGPCIGAECYAFSQHDLGRLARLLGPAVRSETDGGEPALDLAAGVAEALGRADVDLTWASGHCTACSDHGYFSWRARGDRARQAGVVWT